MSCAASSLIDRHFGARIRPAAERRLREHLPGCTACRERYQRWLLLGTLDPELPAAEARLAVGLGLRRRPVARAAWLGAAVVAVALVTLMLARADEPAFAPRGAVESRFFVYRVPAAGAPERAGERIRRGEELAFAYTNPSGRARLMVFAVDEHRHVYWYHPAWTDPDADPHAVPIVADPGIHELPEAIAHELDGSRLVIHALFTDDDVSVREVERRLAAGEPLPGTLIMQPLEVQP